MSARPRIQPVPRAANPTPPLLITRKRARYLLAISLATALRLEKLGVLDPIKLNPTSDNSMTHYRYAQVLALAKEGDDA
jgi:hypothetical protein